MGVTIDSRIVAAFLSATVLMLSMGAMRAADPPLRFVDVGKEGKLVYETDARGNRVPDFSRAGYQDGGVPIPDVPVRVTVAPAEGDDGAHIQAAMDYVSRLPADARGFRGAVLLGRGRFEVAGNLVIRASGVVLRGHGCGTNGAANRSGTAPIRRTKSTRGWQSRWKTWRTPGCVR